ncbi:MAG: hypothetical protein EBX50_15590 [Chitinophagia bacterium]|nr:hypothetical protein [Chitinophagia bacterium]
MNVVAILGRLTPYRGNVITANNRQGTYDIIDEIAKCHREYAGEYDKIADYFSGSTPAETAKKLWTFLKKNVKYSIEPASRQSVKSPAAILASGIYSKTGNDCKHYSLFSGGVLDALRRKGQNIDFVYRFVNYRILETDPQHVFVVLKSRGREFWIDPVLNSFNERKPYINGIDKKIKSGMPVYKISGVDDEIEENYGMPTIGRARRTKQQRQAVRSERKLKRKAKREEKGSFFSRTFVRAGLVVPRNSFLKLVALNLLNIAVKLNETLKNPAKKSKLVKKWKQLGGKPDVLLKNISRGVAKYKKKNTSYIGVKPFLSASRSRIIWPEMTEIVRHKGKKYIRVKHGRRIGAPGISPQFAQTVQTAVQQAEGLQGKRGAQLITKGAGAAAAVTSAALAVSNPVTAGIVASAGAIIAALSEFIGKEPKQAVEMVKENLPPEQKAELAAQESETKKMTAAEPITGRESAARGQEPGASAAPSGSPASREQADEEQTAQDMPGFPGGINKNYLLIGGAALAAILLMRRK